MLNECEECSAVNADGATVCRVCGCPLFLDSSTSAPQSARTTHARTSAVLDPAFKVAPASRRLIEWLVVGVAVTVLVIFAALIFELADRPQQRKEFGPEAPPFAPVLQAPATGPAPPPTVADEAAVASPAASAPSPFASTPLRSSQFAPRKGPARTSAKPAVSGAPTPTGAEADPAVANPPIPGPAALVPAPSEKETGASELCGDKSFLARSLCAAEQCNTPALFDHPECVQMRKRDQERRERLELGG